MSDLRHEQNLAAAVIATAFSDLTSSEAKSRRSATQFLVYELWRADNIWGALLSHVLNRRNVLAEVKKRLGKDWRDTALAVRPTSRAFGRAMVMTR